MTSSVTTNSTVTRLRLAILSTLESDDSHPSAATLLEILGAEHSSLPLLTEHTALEAFARAGPRCRPGCGWVTVR